MTIFALTPLLAVMHIASILHYITYIWLVKWLMLGMSHSGLFDAYKFLCIKFIYVVEVCFISNSSLWHIDNALKTEIQKLK